MSERDKELTNLWFQKARNDLISAKLILKQADGPTDTPCFHSHQAITNYAVETRYPIDGF